MRRILRNVVVAVACGPLALLGACTGDAGSSSASASADAEETAETPPAWALSGDQALDAVGETSDEVSAEGGWCELGSAWWPGPAGGLLADASEYEYETSEGQGTILSICLRVGDPAEIQQLFAEIASSAGADDETGTFAPAPLGQASLGLETIDEDGTVGERRAVLVDAGETLVLASGTRTYYYGPKPGNFTREQVESLAKAAVERLAEPDVQEMLAAAAQQSAYLLSGEEVQAALGLSAGVTDARGFGEDFWVHPSETDTTSMYATYEVERGDDRRVLGGETITRSSDIAQTFAEWEAALEEDSEAFRRYDPAPVGVESFAFEWLEGEVGEAGLRTVTVNTGDALVVIVVWPRDDNLTREQVDDLVTAAVGKVSG